MSALFLELARIILFLSPSPHTFRLRMVSSIVVLAPYGEVPKNLPVLRCATYKLIVSVDAVVGVELLATTLAGKHLATVLPNFVLARHLQRLESFITDITEVNPFSLLCFVPPTLIPSSNNMISLTNLPSTPAGQKMSTPLHGLPKADACLEGDVADDKVDPLVCVQLHQLHTGSRKCKHFFWPNNIT